MDLNEKTVGFALTGSFCTLDQVLVEMEKLKKEGANIVPIISEAVSRTDTRFGKARDWKERIKEITGKEPIETIKDVEPIGPSSLLDVLLVAPCTGNTLAKIANGITDTPVTMAVKAQLRNQKPVVIAISTNDGLNFNARNLGLLLRSRNIYFVPFGQDDPVKKSTSLIAKFEKIIPAVKEALEGRQIQPVLE